MNPISATCSRCGTRMSVPAAAVLLDARPEGLRGWLVCGTCHDVIDVVVPQAAVVEIECPTLVTGHRQQEDEGEAAWREQEKQGHAGLPRRRMSAILARCCRGCNPPKWVRSAYLPGATPSTAS